MLRLLPPWAYAAVAAVALSGAFLAGWKVQGWRCAADREQALRQAQIAFQAQLQRQNEEASEYEREREAARSESRARETQIRTIYRDRIVPAECEPDPVAVGVLRDAVAAANAGSAEPGG